MKEESKIVESKVDSPFLIGELGVAPDESVVVSYQGDHGVLLDYARGEYYGLNPVATFVWKQLCEGKSNAEIVNAIVDEYDVREDIARHDVARLFKDFYDRRIIHTR